MELEVHLKMLQLFVCSEETGRSLMQANVNLLYRSTSFYTLSEAARFKQIGS